MALRRVNLNIDEDLLSQLDGYARSMHINRSSALAVLLSQVFQDQKTMDTLNQLLQVVKDHREGENQP